MQIKIKKTSLIIPTVLFLLTCLLFFFLFREIKNNTEISKQAQMAFDKEASRREEIKDFNDSFKLIEQEKKLFETHFAQKSDIVPFLNTIEKMADSVGTKAEVSFIEVAKDNSGLILEMKGSGSFLEVYKFIMLLENSPYELEFISVEMHNVELGEADKSNTRKSEWEVILKIKLISFL